jgi:hypothetical protein
MNCDVEDVLIFGIENLEVDPVIAVRSVMTRWKGFCDLQVQSRNIHSFEFPFSRAEFHEITTKLSNDINDRIINWKIFDTTEDFAVRNLSQSQHWLIIVHAVFSLNQELSLVERGLN